MPGYDGTGPRGQGPMTGRRSGLCGSGNSNDRQSSALGVGRGGRPRGGGRGRNAGGSGRRQGLLNPRKAGTSARRGSEG